jgi:hypothetical protein
VEKSVGISTKAAIDLLLLAKGAGRMENFGFTRVDVKIDYIQREH